MTSVPNTGDVAHWHGTISSEAPTFNYISDTTVRINTAYLFRMSWVHLHLPSKQQCYNEHNQKDKQTLKEKLNIEVNLFSAEVCIIKMLKNRII